MEIKDFIIGLFSGFLLASIFYYASEKSYDWKVRCSEVETAGALDKVPGCIFYKMWRESNPKAEQPK